MSTNLCFYKMKSDLCQLKVNQKFLILWRKVFIFCLPKKVSFVFKAELLLTRNLDLSAGESLEECIYSSLGRKDFKRKYTILGLSHLFWTFLWCLFPVFSWGSSACGHVERPRVDRTQVAFPLTPAGLYGWFCGGTVVQDSQVRGWCESMVGPWRENRQSVRQC